MSRLQNWRALRNCAKKDLEAGLLSCTGQMRYACKFSVGRPAGQEHFEGLAYTGNNINFNRQEIEWQSLDRDNLVLVKNKWHSLVNTLMKL